MSGERLYSVICLISLSLYVGHGALVNNRPIIGILSQTTSGIYKKYGDSFIHSEYVQYIENGGARVVPIRINETLEYYSKLFNSINGIFFPGGAKSLMLSEYAKAGKIMFDLAIKANQAGDYFPVWGTCLGFQFLTVLVSGTNFLTTTDAENLPLPLHLNTPECQESQLYGSAPCHVIEILQRENITDNAHHYGIQPKMFSLNRKLKGFFKVLSTNEDRQGKIFVSSIEGRSYPVWGTQFHPEQVYNWNPKFNWLHTDDAFLVTQYFSNFFVDKARRNLHSFTDINTEIASMIENVPRIYLQEVDPFRSIYVMNLTNFA